MYQSLPQTAGDGHKIKPRGLDPKNGFFRFESNVKSIIEKNGSCDMSLDPRQRDVTIEVFERWSTRDGSLIVDHGVLGQAGPQGPNKLRPKNRIRWGPLGISGLRARISGKF